MAAPRILWVNTGASIAHAAPVNSWENTCQAPVIALNTLKNKSFDLIVLQLPIPHWNALALFEEIRKFAPQTPVAVRDPGATIVDAVRYVKHGIDSVLPGDPRDAGLILETIAARTGNPHPGSAETRLVGISPEIQRVCQIIRLVGARRATVLITGETGTGKELAARALHEAGPRRDGPWVAVNCSALPGSLLEAELFGHVKGAFTGAVQNRIGRFEQAQRGTLFLDEIGELSSDLQAKLLRVLQEREFERLGSSETIKTDVRVVAATNCGLLQRIEQGRFREDLYYRLNVVPLAMPPLRDRPEDIPLLAGHFMEKICRAENVAVKTCLPSAMDRLRCYSWPGNVRQLENAIEMAVALSADRWELAPDDFPLPATPAARAACDGPLISVPDTGLDYGRTMAWIERSILEQALRKTGGNKKAAAAMLRLKRTTLSAKVRSLEPSAA
ncbi:MAG TPA: sigma-54 dependent transcriptional regulator [Bryobacteraceae bacterium]|nr:sigma-54 dependent transcriptional regulator [Bryobacteraceae bacterium]